MSSSFSIDRRRLHSNATEMDQETNHTCLARCTNVRHKRFKKPGVCAGSVTEFLTKS